MSYTERFTEVHEVLGELFPASYAAEQNVPSSGFINVGMYHRVVIILSAGNIGTSLDADVEVATDNNGSNVRTLKSITQLTEAGGDDNSRVAIEIRGEELNIEGVNYPYLRLEVTPNGATLAGALVLGIIPRYAGVSVTGWDEVVD